MAIDFNTMDKKRVLILGGAILAGLIAVVLTNSYIKDSVDSKVSDIAEKTNRQVQELARRIDESQRSNHANMAKLRQEQQQMIAAQMKKKPVSKQAPQRSLNVTPPMGKRAVTVRVDSMDAVGGLVKPGNVVDVIANLDKPVDVKGKKTEKMTITLFQNVQVLAVGYEDAKKKTLPHRGKIPITLALNPLEAGLATFAQKHGTLQLVLRSVGEQDIYKVDSASWETLEKYMNSIQGTGYDFTPEEKKPKPKKPAPKGPSYQIFRGGKESEI